MSTASRTRSLLRPKCPHCISGVSAEGGRKLNSKGELMGHQHRCRDCKRYWLIKPGQDEELVLNDRAVIPLSAVPQFPGVSDQERKVRVTFALYPMWDRAKIGRLIGCSRESVRQILVGKMLARYAPDLVRYDRERLAAMAGKTVTGEPLTTCHRCVLAANPDTPEWRCSIGMPDAVGDPSFAPLCGAYQPREEGA